MQSAPRPCSSSLPALFPSRPRPPALSATLGAANINPYLLSDSIIVFPLHNAYPLFFSYSQACDALLLSGSSISVSPALEDDLKPFHKLQRFDITAVRFSYFLLLSHA